METPWPELGQLCDNARQVKELCDLLGLEFRGFPHLDGLLEGAMKSGTPLARMIEDPDERPYIWDLEE